MFQKSALDLWHEECRRPAIITGAQLLDKAIGNGVPLRAVTEFYGPPGSGKTQMCLQLCVNVQIPTQLGGLQGAAVYIDTEHGFSARRLRQIAAGCVQQLHRIEEQCSDLSSSSNLRDFTATLILDNVLCSTVSSATELLAAVERLKHQLPAAAPAIRLICIDSLSSLFHQLLSVDRVRVLFALIADLERLAQQHCCAIVLTNELTTRLASPAGAQLVPALGDSHAHRVAQMVALGGVEDKGPDEKSEPAFVARVRKSLSCPESTVLFKITGDGIRDI